MVQIWAPTHPDVGHVSFCTFCLVPVTSHLYPQTTNTSARYHPYPHHLTNPISCIGDWWCWSFLAPPLGSFTVSLHVTPVSCSPEPSLSHQSVGKWSRHWAQALYVWLSPCTWLQNWCSLPSFFSFAYIIKNWISNASKSFVLFCFSHLILQGEHFFVLLHTLWNDHFYWL